MKFVLALLVFVALCYAQEPVRPAIPEVYQAVTMNEVHERNMNFTGKGKSARDQPAGKAIDVQTESRGNATFTTLERYDMHEIYDITSTPRSCHDHAVEGTMPLHWEWVTNATFVGKRRRNRGNETLDIWENRRDGIRFELAVDETMVNVPVWESREFPNGRTEYTEFVNFTTTAAAENTYDVPNECQQKLSCVARAEMIARAKVWTEAKVPYNQGGTYQGYREDCSGYVSMAWQLEKPGRTTETLGGVSKEITKAELMPGDVLLCASEHVVLFAGWADAAKTNYISYEETRPGEGTVTRSTPYPYWYNTACFKPFRYNEAC